MMRKNKLICVLGASGSGKDTITNRLGIEKVISYRTRPKREFETDKKDGYFITSDQFRVLESKMIAKTVYAGYEYGVTSDELSKLHDHDLIYIIDWQGVETLKNHVRTHQTIDVEDIITVWIEANPTSLRSRMIAQGRSLDEINRRMDQYWDYEFDHSSKCDFVVFNREGKLDDAVRQFKEIISALK